MLSVVYTLSYIIYSIASIFRIRIHNHPSRCIVIAQRIRPPCTVCSPPYMCPVCTKSIVIFSYIYALSFRLRPSSSTLEFQCPLFDRLILNLLNRHKVIFFFYIHQRFFAFFYVLTLFLVKIGEKNVFFLQTYRKRCKWGRENEGISWIQR